MLHPAASAVSGPCPKCGTWIDSAQFTLPKEPATRLPEKSAAEQRRSRSVVSGRGRVRADGFLDQEYGERKELYGTIKVLAVSLAALAAILFVTLYLKQWMTY